MVDFEGAGTARRQEDRPARESFSEVDAYRQQIDRSVQLPVVRSTDRPFRP
jgi:hypothetical protein